MPLVDFVGPQANQYRRARWDQIGTSPGRGIVPADDEIGIKPDRDFEIEANAVALLQLDRLRFYVHVCDDAAPVFSRIQFEFNVAVLVSLLLAHRLDLERFGGRGLILRLWRRADRVYEHQGALDSALPASAIPDRDFDYSFVFFFHSFLLR
ncbi:MAG: hypothetical protein WCE49_18070 [Terrimicrobiaceae bacterium]